MPVQRDVAVLVGSLRKESYIRRAAEALTPRRRPADWKRLMSVSPGAVGGFGADHHLHRSAVFLDTPMLQQPEMYIGAAGELFDE